MCTICGPNSTLIVIDVVLCVAFGIIALMAFRRRERFEESPREAYWWGLSALGGFMCWGFRNQYREMSDCLSSGGCEGLATAAFAFQVLATVVAIACFTYAFFGIVDMSVDRVVRRVEEGEAVGRAEDVESE